MDVAGGQAKAGNTVWGWVSTGGEGQKWIMTSDGVIRTQLGKFALDFQGSDPWYKNIVLQPVNGSPTQQWEITASGVIKNKSNGFILMLEDWDPHGAKCQYLVLWNPLAKPIDESNPPANGKWELVDI